MTLLWGGRRRLSGTVLVVLAGLLLSLGGTVPAGSAPAPARGPAGGVAAPASPGTLGSLPTHWPSPNPLWRPRQGTIFNDPLNRPHRIANQLEQAIRQSRRGTTIRIGTYNLSHPHITDLLLHAHNRGVTVRVMVGTNSHEGDYSALRLARRFRNQPGRPDPDNRSRIVKCRASCRGTIGVAHPKIALFEHTGAAFNVVMQGTGNITQIAEHNQWNTLITRNETPRLFGFYKDRFQEMMRDRPVKNGYRYTSIPGDMSTEVYPFTGRFAGQDRTMRILDRIRCRGANGRHSKLRIALASWRGDRGIRAARRVKELYNRGCDVKVMYVEIGGRVHNILRSRSGRGPVPTREYWMDRGKHGTYLHMKAFIFSGNYNGQHRTRKVWGGSANLADGALNADENFWVLNKVEDYRAYARQFGSLWHSDRFTWRTRSAPEVRRQARIEARLEGRAFTDPFQRMRVRD